MRPHHRTQEKCLSYSVSSESYLMFRSVLTAEKAHHSKRTETSGNRVVADVRHGFCDDGISRGRRISSEPKAALQKAAPADPKSSLPMLALGRLDSMPTASTQQACDLRMQLPAHPAGIRP